MQVTALKSPGDNMLEDSVLGNMNIAGKKP